MQKGLLHTILSLVIVFTGQFVFAAGESESNNSYETADMIAQSEVVTGNVGGAGDAYDYFITPLDNQGTIKVYLTYSGGSSGADLDWYIFTKSRAVIGSKSIINTASATDSLIIYCRSDDSVYIRVGASESVNYNFRLEVEEPAPNDNEPNNSFEDAVFFPHTSTVKGRVGYSGAGTDSYDYFYSTLPEDGTLRIYVDKINTSNYDGADFDFYVFNKNQAIIGSYAKINTAIGKLATDTLEIYCRQADTVYFRLGSSSGCYTYSLRYEMLPIAPADVEPNNSFAQAVQFEHTDTVKGRVGYSGTGTDSYDYFYSALPEDGTLRIYVDKINTSNYDGADFDFYVFNKNQAIIGSYAKINTAIGKLATDTLEIYCRQADTVYFRLGSSSGCYTYTLRYEMLPIAPADVEPNNSFAQAVQFEHTDTVKGRVGYSGTGTDSYDYFYSALPEDGTLRIYVDKINTSNSDGADFDFYVFNKNQAIIGSYAKVNTAIGNLATDTLDIYCRQADTVYFRLGSSSGCYTYSLRYEMLPIAPADVEPNNSFAQAVQFEHTDTVKGRVGYSGTGTDSYDYFYSALPEDGTLRIYVDKINTSNYDGADFDFYVFNKNQAIIGSYAKVNTAIGNLATDTLDIYCRQADTVYFRLGSSSGCYTYTLRYEMLPIAPADVEPNNSFAQAVQFEHTDTVKGRVGYSGTSTDSYDYFYSALPEDGTLRIYVDKINTSNSDGADFDFYVFNKNQAIIGSYAKVNTAIGNLATDTLEIYCRQADTVYFRLGSSSGCYTYSLRYEMLSTSEDDSEPNNSIASAVEISLSDTLKGKIGYSGISTDNYDHFKIYYGKRATVTAYLTYNNTSNSTGADLYFNFLNKSGGNLLSRSYINKALGVHRDTIVLTCAQADTLLLRFNSSGCFQYTVTFDVKNEQPEIEIISARMGNHFAFLNKRSNIDEIEWNFGDGTTSTIFSPTKEFSIGEYQVVLRGINNTCGITARDTLSIAVDGIEYYLPGRAAMAGNIGYFHMRMFGGGFDTNAIVLLKRAGTVLTPFNVKSPSGSELNLLYNFKDAVAGMYDIELKLSNGYDTIIKNGFEIFNDIPGYDIDVTVEGPKDIRTGSWNNFTLNVYNNRARVANNVVACLVVPEGVETNVNDIISTQSGSLLVKGDVYDRLTIPYDFFNEIYFDGEFDRNKDTVYINYQDIYQYKDSLMAIPIDSLFDVPFKGTVYHFLIPYIGGNSTHTVNFKLKSNNSATMKTVSYAFPYNLRQNPLSGRALDNIHAAGMQAAALAEYAPNPALKAVGKSAGYVDVGSQVLFTEVFDWWYGVNNADAEFYGKQTLSFAGTYAGNKVPYGDRYEKGIDKINSTKNALKAGTQRIKTDNDLLDFVTDPKMKQRLLNELAENRNLLNKLGPSVSRLEKEAAMNALKNYLSGQGINLTNKQLEKLLFPEKEGQKTNHPKSMNYNEFRSLTSFDPNEIYGPSGYREPKYIRHDKLMKYLVTFENVDTAEAPAQIVIVRVPLDTNIYELDQTYLTDITIGENVYFFEQDRNTYFRDIDLRPAKDMIVRVMANVNKEEGLLEWHFASLDPVTMDLTSDALDGFLPPNIHPHEGEGSVSFISKLKENLPHGTQINAQAEIFFDNNPPIPTSVWTNTIDLQKPTAHLSNTVEYLNDTIVRLNISGTDEESGLQSYRLFVKIDDGEWWPEGLPVLKDQDLTIIFSPDRKYSFYIEAIDSVGNVSDKTPVAEAVIGNSTGTHSNEFQNLSVKIFPNPAKDELNYQISSVVENLSIVIFDMMGKQIIGRDAYGQNGQIDISGIPDGMYIISFSDGKGYESSVKAVFLR